VGAPEVSTGVRELEALTVGITLIKLHAALIIKTVFIFNFLPYEGIIVEGFGLVLHAGPLAGLEMVLPSRAGGPVEIRECGSHHGGHHAALIGLLGTSVASSEIPIVGKAKDVT
jgi:hypothetical protein